MKNQSFSTVLVFLIGDGDRLSGELYRERYCDIPQRFCF